LAQQKFAVAKKFNKKIRPAQGIKSFVGQTSLSEVNCGLGLFSSLSPRGPFAGGAQANF
jgi:hypothetical protein